MVPVRVLLEKYHCATKTWETYLTENLSILMLPITRLRQPVHQADRLLAVGVHGLC